MPKIDDQRYLKEEQYRRPDNLNARILIHRRFSTNPQGWPAWVFERLELAQGLRLADLGCGPADLWLENQARIPEGIYLLLGDLSHGMLLEARRRLGNDTRFAYFNGDIQALPLPGGIFDRVMANHMLYHVPDIDRAVAGMARLLKPGGMAMAATNGLRTQSELFALIREVAPGYEMPEGGAAARFSLQNGAAFFERHFSRVWVEMYPDSLWVTEARSLVEYIYSSATLANGLGGNTRQRLEALFQRRIARDGGIAISKEGGVIYAEGQAARAPSPRPAHGRPL